MSEYFTSVDIAVLFGYLILTTVIGHFMGGKQATIKDFFAGGNRFLGGRCRGRSLRRRLVG